MSFQIGDVVEHTYNDKKMLGIVAEVFNDGRLAVVKQNGEIHRNWLKTQCVTLIRDGQWVVTVELTEGAWDTALTSAVEQLKAAGVDSTRIAFLAFHFGRRVPGGVSSINNLDKFNTLVDELRAERFEVKIKKPEVSLAT